MHGMHHESDLYNLNIIVIFKVGYMFVHSSRECVTLAIRLSSSKLFKFLQHSFNICSHGDMRMNMATPTSKKLIRLVQICKY